MFLFFILGDEGSGSDGVNENDFKLFATAVMSARKDVTEEAGEEAGEEGEENTARINLRERIELERRQWMLLSDLFGRMSTSSASTTSVDDALIVSISKDYFIESIQKNNHNICTDIIDHPSDSCLKMLQYVQRYGKSLQKFQTGLKGEMTLLELSAFVGALTHETRDDEGVEFGAKGLNDAEDY